MRLCISFPFAAKDCSLLPPGKSPGTQPRTRRAGQPWSLTAGLGVSGRLGLRRPRQTSAPPRGPRGFSKGRRVGEEGRVSQGPAPRPADGICSFPLRTLSGRPSDVRVRAPGQLETPARLESAGLSGKGLGEDQVVMPTVVGDKTPWCHAEHVG